MRQNIAGEISRAYEALKFTPTKTLDGHNISLQMNAGLLVDLPQLDQAGADGIGLFRTEFQFMVSEFMPRLKEQTELYRKAIEVAGDRPVTFRTLDLGGDKILPYIDPVPEENPAIGWRDSYCPRSPWPYALSASRARCGGGRAEFARYVSNGHNG